MDIRRFCKLSNYERICTLCNKNIEANDIRAENYIEVRKHNRFRLAHKTCYLNYLKYVKDSWKGE